MILPIELNFLFFFVRNVCEKNLAKPNGFKTATVLEEELLLRPLQFYKSFIDIQPLSE